MSNGRIILLLKDKFEAIPLDGLTFRLIFSFKFEVAISTLNSDKSLIL